MADVFVFFVFLAGCLLFNWNSIKGAVYNEVNC